ncbi:MAG: hypothetical protein CVU90_03220 [Firmicutes bacterium HGW-Firmicutes-15]|nr:MAG: hypothetical protein CVU90_03220 [Firmicutes bacterium HGW-Firmicutes-15]
MISGSWKEKRPILHIPLSPMEIALEIIAALGMVFSFFIIIQVWPILPDTIPTHFGASGKVDGWGGKESLFILPVINIFLLYIPITFLSRYPHIFNYLWPITEQNAQAQYYNARLMLGWIKAEIVGLSAIISWRTIQTALGKTEGLGSMFLFLILLVLFGTMGISMCKSYQAR